MASFTIDFETGDLSQFDSVATDGGKFSAHGDAAIEGSWGGKFVVDDNDVKWGQKDFINKTRLRVGFYFDPNGISMNTDDRWNLLANSTVTSYRVSFRKRADGYKLEAFIRDDVGAWQGTGEVSVSDAPHWVEVDFKVDDDGNNGFAKLWLDPGSPPFGAADAEITGIDNDAWDFDHVRAGVISWGAYTATSGTFYVDYIVANDTGAEIGAPGGIVMSVADLMAVGEDAGTSTTTLASIDFETGDLSQFDSVVADGGKLSVHAAAAIRGSYGLRLAADETTAMWGQVDFSNKTALNVGFYFDPNSIAMGDGDSWDLMTDSAVAQYRVQFRRSAELYQAQILVRDDADVWQSSDWATITDASHWIEVDCQISSAPGANDGYGKLWIDPGDPPFGAADAEVTGVDNDTKDFDDVRIGAVTGLDATTTGVFYVDHIYVSATMAGGPPPPAPPAPEPMSVRVVPGACMLRHEIYLTNDVGLRLADGGGRNPLANFLWLRATRVANGIGWIDVAVPKSFDTSLFLKVDFMIQFWREPRGGALSLWRPYLLRKWKFETFDGIETVTLSGPCVNDLLRRRWVIGYEGAPYTSVLGYADDMMKYLVTHSMSDADLPAPTAGSRAWDHLSVAPDLSLGPAFTKNLAWEGPLLSPSGGGVLPAIARASRIAGTDLFFDVAVSSVSAADIQLEFRTYTGQPGQDLSGYVLFDESRGNMGNTYYEHDASREVNYVYGAGQGEGEARNVQQVYDSDRYNASAWGRCEAVADARRESTDDGVREKARALLRDGEPVKRFGAALKDTAECKYGIHWHWGDKARARYKGMEFIDIIHSVVLSVNQAGEQVTARLDYVSDV